MIIFLEKHPKENEVIESIDCMNGESNSYTIKRHGSSAWYSDTWQRHINRLWLEAIDNATGEMFTSEYELVDTNVMS